MFFSSHFTYSKPYASDIDKNQQGQSGHSKEPLQNAIKNLLAMNETPKTFEDAQKMFKTEKSMPQHENGNNDIKAKDVKTVEIPFCSHKIESKLPIHPTEEEANVSSACSDPLPPSYPIPSYKLELSQEERLAADHILRELVEIRKEGKQQSDPILDTMIRSNNEGFP